MTKHYFVLAYFYAMPFLCETFFDCNLNLCFMRSALTSFCVSSFLFAFLLPANIFAQTGNHPTRAFWRDVREGDIPSAAADRQIVPDRYRTLRLNLEAMKTWLRQAPEREEVSAGTKTGLELVLPNPDGSFTKYAIWRAPVMAPELNAKFPEFQSFAGRSLEGPFRYLRFDFGLFGFHSMTLRNGSVFIDPYAKGNTNDYICYYKKDFTSPYAGRVSCLVDDDNAVSLPSFGADNRSGDCGLFRGYDLALAACGEYTGYFGGTVAGAMSAMGTAVGRVSGVFEIETSVTFSMIANNDLIVYTNAATDPFTDPNNASTAVSQNQSNTNTVIGSANYDIGHVFTLGSGGLAFLGGVCTGSKASATTGLPNPVGDPFYIDFVAHEMGHQFGGNHTQNSNCNRNTPTSMEPGSGTTIMGYAGVCSSGTNVQNNSDDYFHTASMVEIRGFTSSGSGNSCDFSVSTGNLAPVVGALTSYTIPRSTPFVLTATATDPLVGGTPDPLTYCWEQIDIHVSGQGQPMPPQPTNTVGPAFRSFFPDGSSERYFPNLNAVLSNSTPTWEVLPSIGRTMNFRVTVRDNNPMGPCASERSMSVTTAAGAGPFQVTSPNTGVTWPANSVQTVTWNVAGSNASPVNCANVDIMISTDGGQSFSTLLAGTPNDGTQDVTVPADQTSTARVRIQCSTSIFFDISNADFTISPPLPVELTQFGLAKKPNGVQLTWTTASEKNNRVFIVERSLGNNLSFAPIGRVNAKGNGAENTQYTFLDANAQAGNRYYYRLRQEDSDGAAVYSDIKSILMDGTSGNLVLSPNPAHTSLNLRFADDTEGTPREISIWNVEGQLVLFQRLASGEALDITTLESGVYWAQTITEQKVYTGKFIKH